MNYVSCFHLTMISSQRITFNVILADTSVEPAEFFLRSGSNSQELIIGLRVGGLKAEPRMEEVSNSMKNANFWRIPLKIAKLSKG